MKSSDDAPPDVAKPCEPGTPAEDDAVTQANDFETQKHLWIQTLVPVLQSRSPKKDPSDRVQFALDMMAIAAAERITRLCRSDLAQNNEAG